MSVTKVAVLKGHTERVWCVTWNPAGNLLATCSGDKTVRLWGKVGEDWICKAILSSAHTRAVRSVAWAPCGNLLASGSFDATTCIWDKRSGEFECIATLEGHEHEVKSVAWSSCGQYVATCSRDKSVWIWAVEEGSDYDCTSVINSHMQDVKRVLWHPVKDVLVSSSYDNSLKFYKDDFDDWSCFGTLLSHESTVWGMAFNASGSMLATCSDDRSVKIWREYLPGNSEGVATVDNDPTWKCVCTLSRYHHRPVFDVSWCHSTNLLVTASGDNGVKIFQEEMCSDPNAPSFEILASIADAHEEDVNSVDWNSKIEGLFATGSDDCTVKLWQMVLPNKVT